MRTMKRAFLAGLVLAVGSGCGFAGMQDLPLPGGPDVGKNPLVVSADFTDVLSLAREATVKYDGVTVGKVEKIGRLGWNARVTLKLRNDLNLPADVTARIAQTSLLGEKYVELARPARTGAAPGTPARLASGAHIPLANTSRGREVEEVLGALSLLLNGGGIAQLRTITTELDKALGNEEVTRTFLRELNTFVGTLDRNRSTIIATLANVDRLSGQVARDRRTVAAALDTITPAVRNLAGQRQELVTMLARLSDFSQATTQLVRRSGADLVADLEALQPVLTQLQRAGDDLPRVLETVLSFPFPDEVLNAVKGDWVNLDVLVDLAPLTLLGNIAGDDEVLQDLPGLLKPKPKPTTKPSAPAPKPNPLGGLFDLLTSLTGGPR